MRRLAPTLLATAAAAAGCGSNGGSAQETLDPVTACRVVSQHLKVAAIEKRFGKADAIQDFFGDKVVTYRRGGGEWSFQVSERLGTYRALRQPKGAAEQALPCRQ